MPKLATLSAARATRVEAGRIIPAHRFQLNPGSLKATLANIKPAQQMNTLATASTGLKMMISEARHQILTSMEVFSPSAAAAPVDKTPGPVLSKSKAMVLPDRHDSNVRWVKRVFEISGPDALTKPIFCARNAGTAIDGSDLWTADLTLPVRQVRLVATQRQIDQMLTRTPQLTFRDIPSDLREANLKLPYSTGDGTQVMELQGKISESGDAVTFTFTGDAIALAYKLLRDTENARVELLSDYTVFEAVEVDPTVTTITEPVALAVPMARLGATRHADLSSIFGKKMRRADISRRHADVTARPGTAKIKAKRAQFLRKNRLKGRAAILAAAKAAREAKKTAQVVDAPKVTFAKQRIVVNMVHTLDYRGATAARLFVMTNPANGKDQIIRNPPWVHVTGPIRQIEELDIRMLGLEAELRRRVRIFASIVDVGVYHVVPAAYVLGREPETGQLQFHAEVISDPMNAENSAVRVSLGLVPEITSTEELTLRAALERHISATQPLGAVAPALTMGFPTELGHLPDLVWGDQLSQASPPVLDGRTVLLSVTTKTLGFAKLLFDTLATKDRVLSGSLKFNMPDEVVAQSSLLVGLTRTCGTSVAANADGGALHLSELAGYDQNVLGLARAGRSGQVDTLDLAAPIPLTPEAQAQSNHPDIADGEWIADSDISYPDVVDLDSKRINVDEMMTPVIVSTALTQGADFAGRGLQSFLIEVKLAARPPIGVSMAADPASGFFDPQILNLSVPLASALSAGGRVLDYRVTARFDDGSSTQAGWVTHNFGANPDITIRRNNIP